MRKITNTITLNQFAGLAGIGSTTAYRWSRQGLLDSIDVGKRRLDRAAALEWISRNVTKKEGAA